MNTLSKLFLVISTGCIAAAPAAPTFTTRAKTADTTEMTLPEPGLQIDLATSSGGELGASQADGSWRLGVATDGWVRDPDVVIYLKPDATTLSDEEAVLRTSCLGFEALEEHPGDHGFGLLYTCGKVDGGFVGYLGVQQIGDRELGCGYGGTAVRARAAMKSCATLRPAAVATAKR